MGILIKLISLMVFLSLSSIGVAEDKSSIQKTHQSSEGLTLTKEKVQLLLECAEQQIKNSEFEKAIKTLYKGLELIGSDYESPLTIDDTGQKLTLAKIEEKNGRYNVAANLLRNVLTARVNILDSKSE